MLVVLRFLGIILTAVAMSGAFAHLFALPNKMEMSREAYLAAQQTYRGWELLGIPIAGALIITLIQAQVLRARSKAILLTSIAAGCMALSLFVFFLFTFPANQATANWTLLPERWSVLRQQWEYSHAAGAILWFTALSTLTLSALLDRE